MNYINQNRIVLHYVLATIALFMLLASCSESFTEIDPVSFNKKIITRTDIETPEELITTFYDYPENEGKPLLDINVVEEDGVFTIILINDHLQDESVCGEKYMLKAKRKGKSWTVSEIKISYRCCSGRNGIYLGSEWEKGCG